MSALLRSTELDAGLALPSREGSNASVSRCPMWVRSTSIIGRVRSRSALRFWAKIGHFLDATLERRATKTIKRSHRYRRNSDSVFG